MKARKRKRNTDPSRMSKQAKLSARRGGSDPFNQDSSSNEGPDLSLDELHERELGRSERAWRGGSVPTALVDAIILCHKARKPIPLWTAQGAVTLIMMLMRGKSLKTHGRLAHPMRRYRSAMIDYERWDAVKELEDRRHELVAVVQALSDNERDQRPAFANLEHEASVGSRCEAVAELFEQTNNRAKGSPETILRSYKKVNRAMRLRKTADYYLPSYDNPLSSSLLGNKVL